ncbi:peptidoglycan binding domain-containing protein [Streptomyces sp. NPDC096339]|uniref:peptidoglycan binding domain-containing protein n=1 Tax=Streptomyces sp. NPDC096339 TaxID=3366086 RepID=UPI003812E298
MTSNPSTPDPDGPKTETTLTTRIRINIPGSRPIPPVVVRTPVGTNSDSADNGPDAPQAPAPRPALPAAPAQAQPRLEQRPKPQPTRIQAEPEPVAEAEAPASNWFAPRKAPTPPPPAPTPAPAQPPTRSAGAPAPGSAPQLPTRPTGASLPGAPVPGAPLPGASLPGAPVPGPMAAPVPGQAPLPPTPAVPGAGYATPPPTPAAPMSDLAHGFGHGPVPGAPMPAGPVPGGLVPGAPGPDAPGGGSTQPLPAFRAEQGAGPAGPTAGPGLGSGPGGADAPRWPGPGLDTPPPSTARVPAPGPAAPRPAPAPAQAKTAPAAKKKGRSKTVLIGGGVFVLFGVAYGAGLLLNHSDVPKGTTVLNVDISGSRDEAVAKLQTAFGTRAAAPLQVSVGGKQVELKPDKAGLSLDAQTTVRNAAGNDYNPITVIGSLLGNERVADPVMPVDEEKLQVALQELAGTAGSATEATIKFDTGKAVAVPGKAGTTLDVDASVPVVAKAFRDMVETGKSVPPELPVTNKEPTVAQAEIDRAMKEFAEPAMSANAIVKIGGKSIAFGAKSLPKIISMNAVDGHLVEKYDLDALKATYGNTWDGVLITRGTGDKTPVTPQDVAGALTKALRGKTTAERTVVVDTNPS